MSKTLVNTIFLILPISLINWQTICSGSAETLSDNNNQHQVTSPSEKSTPDLSPIYTDVVARKFSIDLSSLSTDDDTYNAQNIRKELLDYSDNLLESLDFKDTKKWPLVYKHHNYAELTEKLQTLHQLYPNITQLYSIGKSVEGRELWVLELSDKAGQHELMKPEFKYVANIHGNEAVGRELLLLLARLLLDNYGQGQTNTSSEYPPSQQFVRKLLAETRIHLLPSMNPDGHEKSAEGCVSERSLKGRLNANHVDMNRNFPDPILKNQPDSNTQPEVLAVMNWSKAIPFVLGAQLHGGSLVVSYPFDGARNLSAISELNPTPDDALFRHLAGVYSSSHASMSRGEICYDHCAMMEEKFPHGIVNGAKWYTLYGSMSDWMYTRTNQLELTIELGCNQYPPANELENYWRYNKRALINLIKEVHKGIKGVVFDLSNGLGLPNVIVKVDTIEHDIVTGPQGDFWRLLLPGHYTVQFYLDGYRPSEPIHVFVGPQMATIIRVALVSDNVDLEQQITQSSANRVKLFQVNHGEEKMEKSSFVMVTILTVLAILAMTVTYYFMWRRKKMNRSIEMS